ncbi:MAG: hypothetical protein GXY76_19410 [Chloroflexi bacterium]|nr:hypothetical protein [Chloroflexota bacterium]
MKEARTDFLLLDGRIVSETENAALVIGEVRKSVHNPLFAEDRPWEVRFDNLYPNVVRNSSDGSYQCWYTLFIVDERTTNAPPSARASLNYMAVQPNARETGVCYAFSRDGIVWEKPELGLSGFEGSTKNNIVLRGPHGAGIFEDKHERNPSQRFKMLTRDDARTTMAVGFSANGLHWGPLAACSEIQAAGDTHNNALWVPELGRYVGITRLWDAASRIRQVGWTSSADFLSWSKATVILEGLEPHLQVYSMPVFRHAGLYLGLPAIYNRDTDRVHTELAWSTDTLQWQRICPGTPLIPNGVKGGYDWGCVYAGSSPIFLQEGIRIYYGGSDGLHTSWRNGFFCLASLRPDGFAGYEPTHPDALGRVLTVPMRGSHDGLRVTADVREGGQVRVVAIDAGGNELCSSGPITQTVTKEPVSWKQGDVPLPGRAARLLFELNRARLYSFALGEDTPV